MNSESKTVDQIYWFFKEITLLIYYLLFIYVSYYMFLMCRETRHAWVGADIFNGLFGGVLLVYPLNVGRYGVVKTFDNWVFWLVILLILTGIGKAIGELIA